MLIFIFFHSDSLLYEIGGVDVYDVMAQHSDEFDLSDYPFDHPMYDDSNCKVIGKFKDELNSVALQEFVGCLPKCYSLLHTGLVKKNVLKDNDVHEKATAKGTRQCVRDRALTHECYRSVILDNASVKVRQNSIQSRKHQLGTYHQRRIALTPYDTKRYIMDDNIMTRAIGHYMNDPSIMPGVVWGDDLVLDDDVVDWDDVNIEMI